MKNKNYIDPNKLEGCDGELSQTEIDTLLRGLDGSDPSSNYPFYPDGEKQTFVGYSYPYILSKIHHAEYSINRLLKVLYDFFSHDYEYTDVHIEIKKNFNMISFKINKIKYYVLPQYVNVMQNTYVIITVFNSKVKKLFIHELSDNVSFLELKKKLSKR